MSTKALEKYQSKTAPLPEQAKTREYFFQTLGNAGVLLSDHDYLKALASQDAKNLDKETKVTSQEVFLVGSAVSLAAMIISPWFLLVSLIFFALTSVSFLNKQTALPCGETVLARFILDAHYVDQSWVTTQKQGKKVKVALLQKTFHADWKKQQTIDQFSFFYRSQMGTSNYKGGKKTGKFEVKEIESQTFELDKENEALDYAIALRVASDEMNTQNREKALQELDSAYQANQMQQLLKSVSS